MNGDTNVTATFNPFAPTLTVTPTYKDFGTRLIGTKTATITIPSNDANSPVSILITGVGR